MPTVKTMMKLLTCAWLLCTCAMAVADDWTTDLQERLEAIDQGFGGNLGVYIRHLGDGRSVELDAGRTWYLASTIKIPLAVAVLREIESGDRSLDDTLALAETDYVDGLGELLWAELDSRHSLERLIHLMIADSDSTATDMLVRLIGEDTLNETVREHMVAEGMEPITTIMQVRHDAYSEVHPRARQLSNMQIVQINSVPLRAGRYEALLEALPIAPGEADAASLEEAFERYYGRGLNSGTLRAFGVILERLVRRQLLDAEHTELLLDSMQRVTTGDRRIKAGLPEGTAFAHKTGTQVRRACDIGVLQPDSDDAVIVATCTEKFDDIENAEKAMADVGRALVSVGLVGAAEPDA